MGNNKTVSLTTAKQPRKVPTLRSPQQFLGTNLQSIHGQCSPVSLGHTQARNFIGFPRKVSPLFQSTPHHYSRRPHKATVWLPEEFLFQVLVHWCRLQAKYQSAIWKVRIEKSYNKERESHAKPLKPLPIQKAFSADTILFCKLYIDKPEALPQQTWCRHGDKRSWSH